MVTKQQSFIQDFIGEMRVCKTLVSTAIVATFVYAKV